MSHQHRDDDDDDDIMMEQQTDPQHKVRRSVFWRGLTRQKSFLVAFLLGVVLLGVVACLTTFPYRQTHSTIQQGSQLDKGLQLPPIAQLSPGANKYVLVKAESTTVSNNNPQQKQTAATLWFVKSASPNECGGKYHRHVAKALVKQLESLGYQVEVTGGGRIRYDAETQSAVVYGYSHRYGKGDHVRAAKLIHDNTEIRATYNLSDDLY